MEAELAVPLSEMTLDSTESAPVLSPFESLPRDLAWNIIDYALESICTLRSTSQAMKSLVDEYSMHRHPRIVELLEISGAYRKNLFTFSIMVDANMVRMFELRLIRHPPFGFLENISSTPFDEQNKGMCEYTFRLNLRADCSRELAYLNECVGTRIKRTNIHGWMNAYSMAAFDVVLDGVKIDQHERQISEAGVDQLLEFVEAHNVEHLKLTVKEIGSHDPGDLLLRLSSLVTSLHICQKRVQSTRDVPLDTPPKAWHHFFDTPYVDWDETILEMFSRKIEKLSIYNDVCPGYLDAQEIGVLIERLPKLGKKVWFSATCGRYKDLSIVEEDHIIQVLFDMMHMVLRIKHLSVQDEPFWK